MVAIGSVFVVTVLYIVVERFARGGGGDRPPKDVARFQAHSTLAGVGFTTVEADLVVHHPVRRRIVQTLMLLSGAGLVTLIASLLLSFLDASPTPVAGERLAVLVVGLAVIWTLARCRIIDRGLQTLIGRCVAGRISISGTAHSSLSFIATPQCRRSRSQPAAGLAHRAGRAAPRRQGRPGTPRSVARQKQQIHEQITSDR